jgi:uncharacterized alkaline shock family protein YloU
VNAAHDAEPGLTVARRVVAEMIALAALEVPGVGRIGRGGPRWRAWLTGSPVRVRVRDGRVEARVFLVARPGQPLGALAAGVRSAVAASIERLLGLEVGQIVVVVDGVGA